MMGAKNGTCGELSRSIQIRFVRLEPCTHAILSALFSRPSARGLENHGLTGTLGMRKVYFGGSSLLKNLAGFPATITLAGTSLVTTLPAPTTAFSPTVTLDRIVLPEPIEAPFLTRVTSTFQSPSACSVPSGFAARG